MRAGSSVTWALAAVLALTMLAPGRAHAEAPPETPAEYYQRGVTLDEAGDYEAAWEHYRRAVDADPGARFARRARARMDAIRRITASPVTEALDALRRDYASLTPTERHRRGQAIVDRAERPDDAYAARMWLAGELAFSGGAPESIVRLALEAARLPDRTPGELEIALVEAARGADTTTRRVEVLRAIGELQRQYPEAPDSAFRIAREEARDGIGRDVAFPLSVVASLALVGLAAVRRRPGRFGRPFWKRAAFIAYFFGAGALLGENWEHGHAGAFLSAAPVMVVVHALSGLAAPTEDAGTADRLASAGVIGAATLGAIYLIFDAWGHNALFGL